MTGPFNPQGNVEPGFCGFGPSVPMSSSGICSSARGVMPGGGVTQASKLQQIAELVGSLDANQTRTLQQMLGERLDSQSRMNQGMFVVNQVLEVSGMRMCVCLEFRKVSTKVPTRVMSLPRPKSGLVQRRFQK